MMLMMSAATMVSATRGPDLHSAVQPAHYCMSPAAATVEPVQMRGLQGSVQQSLHLHEPLHSNLVPVLWPQTHIPLHDNVARLVSCQATAAPHAHDHAVNWEYAEVLACKAVLGM